MADNLKFYWTKLVEAVREEKIFSTFVESSSLVRPHKQAKQQVSSCFNFSFYWTLKTRANELNLDLDSFRKSEKQRQQQTIGLNEISSDGEH